MYNFAIVINKLRMHTVEENNIVHRTSKIYKERGPNTSFLVKLFFVVCSICEKLQRQNQTSN